MTNSTNWSADRRLDILILGPMSEDETVAASCIPVQRAVQALLKEQKIASVLDLAGIAEGDRKVHVPEQIGGQDIIAGVLSRLDIADLVIFNLTPKKGESQASGNVMYELGLVHSLGIPAMFVMEKEAPGEAKRKVPFYVGQTHQHRVADFSEEALKDALRPTLIDFLREDDVANDYINDRITQFYGGLPIVDISAAAGLATGYYYNFLSRLITEGGFLGLYPKLIRKVVVVRPETIESSYQEDVAKLKQVLANRGLVLKQGEKLDPPPGDTLGILWFDHVDGIVVDIPRTIYPLRRAPRLLAYHDRHKRLKAGEAERVFQQRLLRFSEALLDRFREGIDYQIRIDGPRVRKSMVIHTDMRNVAETVARLSLAK